MHDPSPVVLVPGLGCSARLYAPQAPALWRFGPVTVADHTRDETMDGVAARILAAAPPRFALAGLSMGGYIAFAILRRAAERVVKLALLDTSARPDTTEQAERRKTLIDLARSGRFAEVNEILWPLVVHRARHGDAALKSVFLAMADDVGAEAFVRQQTALMGRPDSRPMLASIRCPTLVLVGDADELTPPDRSEEMAAAIPGAHLVTVPDCGHLSTLERPEAVTAALVDWIG